MGGKNRTIAISESVIQAFDAVISKSRGVERKGVTTPYTSLNGHMFSFLSKDGVLNLRLPKEDREYFLQFYEAALTVQHGAVMKEYVCVPNGLLRDTPALSKHFQISVAYVKSLKPK